MPNNIGRNRLLGESNCKTCGVILTRANAVIKQDTIGPNCYTCFRRNHNKWRNESRLDPEVMRKHKEDGRQRYLEKSYGISEEEYNKLFVIQNGFCEICNKVCITGRKLSVDHNHITGLVRGLLCQKCNSIIGFCNEDIELLEKVRDYLLKYGILDSIEKTS